MRGNKFRATGKVFGVGINDANYSVNPSGGDKCVFYIKWARMLYRCYSESHHRVHPSYSGVTVCEDWLTFSKFKAWMELQDWQGKELDKDILCPGNKVYGPENCAFVSHAVNAFVLERARDRGLWPVGVYFDREKNKYRAHMNLDGRQKKLGRFNTPEQAHLAWAVAKRELLETLLSRENPVEKVADALRAKYKKILKLAVKACNESRD